MTTGKCSKFCGLIFFLPVSVLTELSHKGFKRPVFIYLAASDFEGSPSDRSSLHMEGYFIAVLGLCKGAVNLLSRLPANMLLWMSDYMKIYIECL